MLKSSSVQICFGVELVLLPLIKFVRITVKHRLFRQRMDSEVQTAGLSTVKAPNVCPPCLCLDSLHWNQTDSGAALIVALCQRNMKRIKT